jgi:short-subunit dehydrogenase
MAGKKELKDAAIKLKEMSPAPMDSVFNKQAKAEALKKRSDRSEMVVKDVPPTTPGTIHLHKLQHNFSEKIRPFHLICALPLPYPPPPH